jgi:hypothetical protein
VPRFGQLGVIAAMQGIHCTSDGPWIPSRLGEERTRVTSYPWRDLIETGAVIGNGTDVPVEPINAIASYYASVSRMMINGEKFHPEHVMTREEALTSYTLNNAYCRVRRGHQGLADARQAGRHRGAVAGHPDRCGGSDPRHRGRPDLRRRRAALRPLSHGENPPAVDLRDGNRRGGGRRLVPPGALWWLAVIVPLAVVAVHDVVQREHTLLRNFPIVGRIRYLMEKFRPQIQQYFIESNIDAYPIEREFREIVYQRAKGELETRPLGTQRDVYEIGYEWAAHSMAAHEGPKQAPRVLDRRHGHARPYSASLLNISAMSYGALSNRAILALNQGARLEGFAHNTGEGGIADQHLEGGGDLIWQIGSGYFGCRDRDGRFDPRRSPSPRAARPSR